MPYSVKGFFEIDEDMVQILLVLEVLFTQDSEVEDKVGNRPVNMSIDQTSGHYWL